MAEVVLKPRVAWPRRARVGGRYRVSVDLDVESWPFDVEEIAIHASLRAGPALACRPLDDSVIVVHRFGGAYGPACFLVEAREAHPATALLLDLYGPGGERLGRVRLGEVFVDAGVEDEGREVRVEAAGPLVILHLGNLLFTAGRRWDEDGVLRALAVDLARSVQEDGPPDLLVVTGDVAATGAAEEYARAQEWVEECLMAQVGLPTHRMFWVPGNHDTDRRAGSLRQTRSALLDAAEVGAVEAAVTRTRRLTQERRANWTRFMRALRPGKLDPALHSYTTSRDVRGWRVRLLALDTAWLDDEDARPGQLLLAAPRLPALLSACDDADLVAAFSHHAFDWLAGWPRREVEGPIRARAHLLLHGAGHGAAPELRPDEQAACLVVRGGALGGSGAARVAWQRYTVDPDAGTADVEVRRWGEAGFERGEGVEGFDIRKDTEESGYQARVVLVGDRARALYETLDKADESGTDPARLRIARLSMAIDVDGEVVEAWLWCLPPSLDELLLDLVGAADLVVAGDDVRLEGRVDADAVMGVEEVATGLMDHLAEAPRLAATDPEAEARVEAGLALLQEVATTGWPCLRVEGELPKRCAEHWVDAGAAVLVGNDDGSWLVLTALVPEAAAPLEHAVVATLAVEGHEPREAWAALAVAEDRPFPVPPRRFARWAVEVDERWGWEVLAEPGGCRVVLRDRLPDDPEAAAWAEGVLRRHFGGEAVRAAPDLLLMVSSSPMFGGLAGALAAGLSQLGVRTWTWGTEEPEERPRALLWVRESPRAWQQIAVQKVGPPEPSLEEEARPLAAGGRALVVQHADAGEAGVPRELARAPRLLLGPSDQPSDLLPAVLRWLWSLEPRQHALLVPMTPAGLPRVTVLGGSAPPRGFAERQVLGFEAARALVESGAVGEGTRLAVVGEDVGALMVAACCALAGATVTTWSRPELAAEHGFAPRMAPHQHRFPAAGWNERRAGLPLFDWEAGDNDRVVPQILDELARIRHFVGERWREASALPPSATSLRPGALPEVAGETFDHVVLAPTGFDTMSAEAAREASTNAIVVEGDERALAWSVAVTGSDDTTSILEMVDREALDRVLAQWPAEGRLQGLLEGTSHLAHPLAGRISRERTVLQLLPAGRPAPAFSPEVLAAGILVGAKALSVAEGTATLTGKGPPLEVMVSGERVQMAMKADALLTLEPGIGPRAHLDRLAPGLALPPAPRWPAEVSLDTAYWLLKLSYVTRPVETA